MFSHNGKISARQALILLILQMFNINFLLLPRVCTYYLGRDGYILPIISILVGLVYLYFIQALVVKFPDLTLVEILKKIFTSWIADILIVLFTIKLVVSTSFELRMFGEIINQVMLPKTPLTVIMIVMLLTVSYLVKSGIEATARMSEILVYFIFVPVIIVFIAVAINSDYGELLPLFQTDINKVSVGALMVSFIFSPLEFLLMMIGLMKKPEKIMKVGIIAIVLIGIIGAVITLLTIVKIGLGETERQIWPVLGLLQSIGLNNSVVENQEILMLTIWILSIFIYISSGLYFSSLIGSRSYKFKRENIFVLPLVPVILAIALWPQNLVQAYTYYLNFQMFYGILLMLPVTLVLLLISKFRRLGYEK